VRGDSSNLLGLEKCWKSIWSIHSPEKMKIVVWRIVHDCLPTGFQLQRQNIPIEDQSADVQSVWNTYFAFAPLSGLGGIVSRSRCRSRCL
jgi:hypothetical protein